MLRSPNFFCRQQGVGGALGRLSREPQVFRLFGPRAAWWIHGGSERKKERSQKRERQVTSPRARAGAAAATARVCPRTATRRSARGSQLSGGETRGEFLTVTGTAATCIPHGDAVRPKRFLDTHSTAKHSKECPRRIDAQCRDR